MKVPVGSPVPTAIAVVLVFACMLLFPSPANPQTYKVLYAFTGKADGGQPYSGVVFDRAGNLYGTTTQGGEAGCFGGTCGVAFELSPGPEGWSDLTLHTGYRPYSTLVFDKSGNLYGTTYSGGDPTCNPPYGCGTAFKLAPGKNSPWKETILHRFQGSDGRSPYFVKLAIDPAGNLYGTALAGGNPGCYLNLGCGVVFEITP